MYSFELLNVEDHFQLGNIGLTVVPSLSVAGTGRWNDFHTTMKVIAPDGTESVHQAHVGTWHFNIRDVKAGIDCRWRIVISFPEADKAQIPVGSIVYVSEADGLRLQGQQG
ncbi:hypothetical protein [Marinobacter zhejiangensis]|nr:hypothetical protein [Marinobacter zhejiangensis]